MSDRPEFKGPNPVMLRIAENASKALVEISKVKNPSAKQEEALVHLADATAGAVCSFYAQVATMDTTKPDLEEILRKTKL